eukprot:439198_1
MAQEDVKYNEYASEEWLVIGEKANFNGNSVQFLSKASAYGTKLISSGKHEWTIKSTFAPRSCQWIGVTTDFTSDAKFAGKANSFWYCNTCKEMECNVGSGRKRLAKTEENWNSGDFITVKLDLDANTIAWYKNSNKKPMATHSGVPSGTYTIAVYASEKNDMFAIMSSKSNSLPVLSIENQIFPIIKHSMNDLTNFEEKIKQYDTTNLLKSNESIKKFNDEYKVMVKQFSDYICILNKAAKLISNKLNPTTDYKTWDLKQVIRYICSLENGKFIKYQSTLEKTMGEQEFTGKDLQHVEKNDLLAFGVKNFGDRAALY